MSDVVISYQVIADEKEIKSLARKIAIEQSVERISSLPEGPLGLIPSAIN